MQTCIYCLKSEQHIKECTHETCELFNIQNLYYFNIKALKHLH